MIKFIIIASLGLITSCGASKKAKSVEAVEEVVPKTENVMSAERPMSEEDMINIEGTVRINDKGCPVYIEMVEGDLFSLVYPVNLEDKFKVDGKKIVFSYTPSRAQSFEGCEVTRVIAVSEVVEK